MENQKQKSLETAREDHNLPPDVKKYVDKLVNNIATKEEKKYYNTLIPFSQFKAHIKEVFYNNVSLLCKQISLGKGIVKHNLELDEKNNPNIAQEATFASFEKAIEKAKERIKDPAIIRDIDFNKSSIQELSNISWDFMDRAFAVGKKFMTEQLYEASTVFIFLRYINPTVFEYWLFEAICLHKSGNLTDALMSYGMSLMLEPQNPYVFFQMASLFYESEEIESSNKALDIAIEYAKDNQTYPDLYEKALLAKEKLAVEKAA